MHGGHPQPQTKNLKAQILLEAKIWHIMSLDVKLQIFSSKFEVVVGGCLASDPPTTTPKLQLNFKSKKSSCSLGVVVGGCLASDTSPPHHHYLKLWQENFLSPKS